MWETGAFWGMWNPGADIDPKRDNGAETLRVGAWQRRESGLIGSMEAGGETILLH